MGSYTIYVYSMNLDISDPIEIPRQRTTAKVKYSSLWYLLVIVIIILSLIVPLKMLLVFLLMPNILGYSNRRKLVL